MDIEAPFIILIALVVAIVLIYLWYLACREFAFIASEKGWSERRYFRFCFWMGLIGMLMVIALPDRKGGASAAPAGSSGADPAPVPLPAKQIIDGVSNAVHRVRDAAPAFQKAFLQAKPPVDENDTAGHDGATWQCTCRAVNPAGASICRDCRSTWHCVCGHINPRTTYRCSLCKAWHCTCGQVNPASRGVCSACSTAKPVDSAARNAPQISAQPSCKPAVTGNWTCSCGEHVSAQQQRCPACRSWHCSCGLVNPAHKGQCTCGETKPR